VIWISLGKFRANFVSYEIFKKPVLALFKSLFTYWEFRI
jgi:hypothetical protein